jgi:transcriptional regulator with XRE-family HTH domain
VSACGVQEKGDTVRPGHAAAAPPDREAPPERRLGERIRSRRRERGLTLVEVAERANLSHPFLSQVERGRAQPSMSSLFRIARALGVTQDWLLAAGGPSTATEPVAVLRQDEGISVPATGDGVARQLLAEPGRFIPTEFVNPGTSFQEFFEHEGVEFVYIAQGALDVELGDGRLITLATGECMRYPGSIPHRWRAARPGPTRVLMIHTDLAGGAALDPPAH